MQLARPLSPVSAGLAWGLLAAAIWSVYAVLARLGIRSGLSPLDMTLLRFTPGALVMLPFVWHWGLRDLAGIGWRRGVVLAALSGPVFSLLMMTGFAYAPLAHGAVIAPASQMLVGIGLSAWLAHAPVTRETVTGGVFVLLGLAFMGGDALLHAEGSSVLLGDALLRPRAAAGDFSVRCRGAGGSMRCASPASRWCWRSRCSRRCTQRWPTRARCSRRRLDSSRCRRWPMASVPAWSRCWPTAALRVAGPGAGGLLAAIVPGAASLLAIPVLGETPTALQVAGILAVVAGLLLAFGAVRMLLERRRGAQT